MWLPRVPLFSKARTLPTHAPSGGAKRPTHCGALLASFALVCAGLGTSQASAQLSMLHASGRNIVNANGTVVPLRGVNLGGLFVMEQWMAPLDSDFVGNGSPNSGNDTYGVENWLANNYTPTPSTEQSMISTYQNAWIQASDLDNIKNAGFNVIRVPVWWGQFFQLPLSSVSTSGWRSDAFTYLDWLVSNAGSRGIYVIIDMHGAVGSQSNSDSTGQQNTNQYWSNGNYQSLTNYMWQQIASHYNGNTTVAGYDLLNEPDNPPSDSAVISAYSSIYSAVRGVDPNHMIFIEGCWGNWNWSMLPNPSSQGWSNVVYEMHAYPPAPGSGGSASADNAQADGQVSDFNNHSNYNVPGYIGEFTAWNFGGAAWQYTVNDYNNAGLSWTMWTYKSRTTNDGWGYYTLTGNPPIPHIYHDSPSTIANDWSQWTTSANFSLNGNLGGINGGGVNTGAGSGGTTTPTTPGTVSTSTWYNVVNQKSGLCLDATGKGTSNGTTVQQWACGSQQYNQEWQFQSQGTGVYSIVNRNAPAQAVDVTGMATANGSPLQTWTYGGGTNQQWKVTASGTGFTIVGVASGKCMDDPGSSMANGTQQQIWGCDSTPAQVWTLNAQP